MKIGILTFWDTLDNYGQIMQCYALQKYLKNAGHDVFLIKYSSKKDFSNTYYLKNIYKIFNLRKLLSFVLYKLNEKKSEKETLIHDRKFNKFRDENFNFSIQYDSYADLKANPPEADMYIVGSDQVWNNKFYPEKAYNAYFLNFGDPSIKRVSYAASWGKETLSMHDKKIITPMLSRFDYVSVREQIGIDLCKQCGYIDAEWVPDPTLLLDTTEYKSLFSNIKLEINRRYILLYMLNNTYAFDIGRVYDFAKQRDLEVIYVTGNGVVDEYKKYYASPAEWLSLVYNAEYVITNSFHCCVFSSIFDKKFAVIQLTGTWSKMNNRIDSLFKLLKIKNRYLLEDNFSILDEDYVKKEIDINRFREIIFSME